MYEIINPDTGRTVTTFAVTEHARAAAFVRGTNFEIVYVALAA